MDKFGYIRGRRGPPGPAGKDAFDMAGWIPKALLKMFRENSDCTFYFKSETDCIWYDEKKQPIVYQITEIVILMHCAYHISTNLSISMENSTPSL